MRQFVGFVIAVLSIGASSCISTHQSAFVGVPAVMWQRGGAEIVMNNGDTVSRRNIDLVFRYAPSMVEDKNWMELNITTIAPDSVEIMERVVVKGLDASQAVLNGYRLYEHRYRSDVVWRQMGDYRIVVAPSHDSQLINGILDVGVNITLAED